MTRKGIQALSPFEILRRHTITHNMFNDDSYIVYIYIVYAVIKIFPTYFSVIHDYFTIVKLSRLCSFGRSTFSCVFCYQYERRHHSQNFIAEVLFSLYDKIAHE